MGYALASDLDTYSPNTVHPDDVAGFFRAAARLVARATRRAIFSVDTLGVATDAAVIAAMRDAECEQVVQWVNAGVNPMGVVDRDQLVTARTVTSGPRTVTESFAPSAVALVPTDQLHPAAAAILGDAGLLAGTVYGVRGQW